MKTKNVGGEIPIIGLLNTTFNSLPTKRSFLKRVLKCT